MAAATAGHPAKDRGHPPHDPPSRRPEEVIRMSQDMKTLDVEWSAEWDNEAGPGWDWFVSVPGREPIMGLDEDLARRIVADHNAALK